MLKRRLFGRFLKFDYKNYWNDRYKEGGNSGEGSYGVLASYKADFLNKFIIENNIQNVFEFGCGDGNNLQFYRCKNYVGFDVAATSIQLCIKKHEADPTKSFLLYNPSAFLNRHIQADLVLSLDVLYHIIDENEFVKSLDDIFSTSSKFVILYTNIAAKPYDPSKGWWVYYRDTFEYLKKYTGFRIVETIQNPHTDLTDAHFIILERI